MEKKLLIALITTLLSSTALAAGSHSFSTDSAAGGSSHAGMKAQGSVHTGMSASLPSFDSLDTNKDGTLSKSEYDDGMRSHHSAMHDSKTHAMDKTGMKDSSGTATSNVESRSVTGASSDGATGSIDADADADADLSVGGTGSSVSGSGEATSRNPLTEHHVP